MEVIFDFSSSHTHNLSKELIKIHTNTITMEIFYLQSYLHLKKLQVWHTGMYYCVNYYVLRV